MRPGGRSERVRRAVLASTLNLMLEHGLRAMTIPDIARDAGVHPTTIYRRWGIEGHARGRRDRGRIETKWRRRRIPAAFDGDLFAFVSSIAGALRVKQVRELATSMAGLSEPGAFEVRQTYWQARFDIVEKIFEQAIERGELEGGT